MKKMFVSLVLLTLLTATALPTLAGELAGERAAPRWRQVFPPISPPVRADHAMAYDTARGVAVLFGGYSNGVELNDTWEWISQTRTWVERQPAHRPPVHYGHAMAYDAARGVTVLFGGLGDNVVYLNDTWIWDGNDWTQVFSATAPAARWLHAMAYDAQREVTVLFGGEGWPATALSDTWEWNGLDWSQQMVVGPSVRYGHAMAYDTQRNVVVLFGGDDSWGWGTYFNDTWERAGNGDWVEAVPVRRPPVRQRMAATYFVVGQQTVIFGGLGSTSNRDDTWVWDGQNWRTKTFSPRPLARGATAMTYDPNLGSALLFGGANYGVSLNDTWLFR
ncbi:MAG: kelch repeat-containing protein [Chloroflexota bacterium]